MPNTEKTPLQVAIEALETILAGSEPEGRWITLDGEAPDGGHDQTLLPGGFYDRDNPPEGYDEKGFVGYDDDRADLEEPAEPVYWEAYTEEEQASWLGTIAYRAKSALKQIKEMTAPAG